MFKKPFLCFLAAVFVFQGIVAVVVGLDHPVFQDESHFIDTIRHFAGPLSLEKLRDYRQVAGPLVFFLYAKWGDLFGFELRTLRTLSVILAILTYAAYYLLLRHVFDSDRIAFLAAGLLVVHPYMIRLSIVFFTDVVPLLCMILLLLLLSRGRVVAPAVLLAAMLVSRQYSVFVLTGVVLFWGMRALLCAEGRSRAVGVLAACVLSLVPFGLLALLWRGVHPPAGAFWIPPDEPLYHPNYLTAYILLTPIYVAPIVLVRLRAIYGSFRTVLAGTALSAWYVLFPVMVPRAAIFRRGPAPAVGIFHRFTQIVTGEHFYLTHLVLLVCFAAGMPILLTLIRDACRRIRERTFDLPLLLDLAILSFLVIMPFSYQFWEKYMMPLVPLVSVRLLLLGRTPSPRVRLP